MKEANIPVDGAAPDWPLRPWIIAALLGLAGLAIHFASGGRGPDVSEGWRAALTALLFFGPLALAFTLEPDRRAGPIAFAVLAGLIMAGLAWRAVSGGDQYATPQYGFVAGLIATAIALPLFQAGFHRTRWDTPYPRIHGHAWSDAISAAGALAFTGASWLLLLVLSELFHLLKIDFLRDVMDEGWFGWTWSGAAFGAALGVLRNELGIIGTLQRVVMVVLSILAVPLAAGLTLFLGAMILSGPDVLWQATRNATPVLLMCAAGAWVLVNAIVRDDEEAASTNRILRVAALVLALAVLPLTVFAAVSLGTRIAQHGLSPERLWGLVAIAVACAYGLAWLVAVVRGSRGQVGWRERLRRANLHLAVLISGVALFLALPILDFGAISARQQVARLESGAVSADKFDYSALRWDFGNAGRRALDRLAGNNDPAIARRAGEALRQKVRPYNVGLTADERAYTLRVQPADPALERLVRDNIEANPYRCVNHCVALDLGTLPDGRRDVAIVSGGGYTRVTLPEAQLEGGTPPPMVTPPLPKPVGPRSKVEIRTIPRRYIVVDGVPLDAPLDQASNSLEGRPPRR
ncbi:DUF4153 domain-containing protein [Tsuneonella deserti]|uniref:DUF4153 domain-containing protein n=1 Tax=Tsuneonella deserti TaxID=2035528 RepID=A0ABQ1SB96_9SPHN|nr:DUF4153 domain-containing protein [Tsuneonella deserti]GGD98854.1 DUF4153 domain-containing protein [Tsuneonella deserti]